MKMKAKYKITAENAKEIKEYRKKIKDKTTDRRLQAVQLLGEGYTPKEICQKLDADKRQVSYWASRYCQFGIKGLDGQKGGRKRENISFEEEKALLEQFKEKAEQGQIIEVSEIREAYEKAADKPIHPNQIYAVLHRHSWRKVMPRSKHPKKANEEAIEASKKLKLKWKKSLSN